MLSPLIMKYFWPVAGLIVGFCFLSMWLRSRKRRVPKIPAPKPRNSVLEPAARTVTKTMADVAHPAVPAAPTAPAIPAVPAAPVATPVVATMEAPRQTPVYQPAPSVISRYDSANLDSGWDGRRLLETTGMLPRNTNPMPRVLPEDVPGIDDSDRAFGSWLNPGLAAMLPESAERREQARKDLMSAGFYNPHALENLAATRYVLMMLAVVFFGCMVLVVPRQLEPYMVACCVLGPLLGWALPSLYIRSKANERKHEIERAMPDLLDMLNMCVSQGLTVPDSLQRIGRDFRSVYPALSQELSIVNDQAKISTLQTALENFSNRIDLPEVHSLTSLLIQTERMGTSISQALITYSDTMRESQRQQADEKGNRATFRLLFPTVLCLMPAVYLFLLGPAINELQRFFYGGAMDSINSSSQVVQRMNATRNQGANPASPFQNGRRPQR